MCEENPLIEIGDHDVNLLREHIGLFPRSGLSISLRAYLNSEISPFPAVPDDEKNTDDSGSVTGDKSGKDIVETDAPDQRLDAMIDGLEKSPMSLLCHRILGEYYLLLDEYENAVDTARGGLKLATGESQRTGLACQKYVVSDVWKNKSLA